VMSGPRWTVMGSPHAAPPPRRDFPRGLTFPSLSIKGNASGHADVPITEVPLLTIRRGSGTPRPASLGVDRPACSGGCVHRHAGWS
jgi:hypothetical protein